MAKHSSEGLGWRKVAELSTSPTLGSPDEHTFCAVKNKTNYKNSKNAGEITSATVSSNYFLFQNNENEFTRGLVQYLGYSLILVSTLGPSLAITGSFNPLYTH